MLDSQYHRTGRIKATVNNIFGKNNTNIISTDTNNHKSEDSLQILAGVMSDNPMHISEPVQSNYVILTSNQTMESQRLKVLKYIQTYRTFYIQYQEWTVSVQTTEKSENLILMEPCKVFLKNSSQFRSNREVYEEKLHFRTKCGEAQGYVSDMNGLTIKQHKIKQFQHIVCTYVAQTISQRKTQPQKILEQIST